MLTSVIASLVAVLLLSFLLIYKKDMIGKMFALTMSVPANEFSQQLEQTADSIIRRLEDEATQLEVLLEEAESKIGMLSHQVEHANRVIEQLTDLDKNQTRVEQQQAVMSENIIHIPVSTLSPEVEATKATNVSDDDSRIAVKESVNFKKHRLIIAMADQGYNMTEIAKATGMGKGEIMLLLQLNKK